MRINIFLSILFFLISHLIHGQEENNKFDHFVVSHTIELNIPTHYEKGILIYDGEHEGLQTLFSENSIYLFEKAFVYSQNNYLKKVWQLHSSNKNLGLEILEYAGDIFNYQEEMPVAELSFHPNDYGTNSPLPNQGAPLNNDHFDFTKVPEAWDISQGSASVKIVISDTKVLNNNDFSGKLSYSSNFPAPDFLNNNSQSLAVHGTTSAGLAAANIDNSFGMAGICGNCSVINMGYAQSFLEQASLNVYNEMLRMSYLDKYIFNCSWGTSYSPIFDPIIEEIIANGSVIVAASGNKNWHQYGNQVTDFPAGFDKVISVSSVGFRHKLGESLLSDANGAYYTRSVEHHLSHSVGYLNNNPNGGVGVNYPIGTASLNNKVDILAPTHWMSNYGYWALYNVQQHVLFHTSPAAPQVTGMIGLMLSVNQCLEYDEVDSIIKLASTNIDSIQANQYLSGNYGSGTMNVYKSVKMASDMQDPIGIVDVSHQDFSRWNFILKSSPFQIDIHNQTFRDDSTVDFTAKDAIFIKDGTILKPNNNGEVHLKINANLSCSPRTYPIPLPPIAPNNKKSAEANTNSIEKDSWNIYPNPAKDKFEVISKDDIELILLYSIEGRLISVEKIEKNSTNFTVNTSDLSTGSYIVKVKTGSYFQSKLLIIE